ncbi:MAG: ester cyclase [Acidobacteriia bacterium]|nr:ester cyclase [Terriglobia bacterium]
MSRQENIDAVQSAQLRFRVRDLDGYLQLYSSSVMHHGFSSRIRPGIPGLRDHYTSLLNAFPDMQIEINDVIADGDKVVHRFKFNGTHKGDFLGVPATGKRVSAPGVHIYLFLDGKVVEVWQVLDTFKFLSQVGAVPQLREMKSKAAR